MSIVFIGTPAFAVPSLRRLVSAGYEVGAVITQPDRPAGRGRQTRPSPVKEAAQELGITVLQPPSLRQAEALQQVKALRPEVMVTVAYGQILRQEFLDIAPKGILNVHPSLLPKYRGASPIPAAILSGDDTTGVTIMLMDAGMDSGPILAQRPFPIAPADTAGSLSETLSTEGAGLLAETLRRWLAGDITPESQDESQASVTRLLKKEDGRIDWTRPAEEIWRQVRAYNPWPGAHTRLDGTLVHIWEARTADFETGAPPGTVVSSTGESELKDSESGFAVQTGRGLLVPLELQREGRKRLSTEEFVRGSRDLLGRRLV